MGAAHRLHEETSAADPLDMVEMLAARHDWPLVRSGESEAQLIVTGDHADYQLTLGWHDELESLQLACMFSLKARAARGGEMARLVGRINERLLMGHFEYWENEGLALYRDSLNLAGGAPVSETQCQSLIHLAISACERYYPAFQFVLWAGRSASEALDACLFETAGEA